VKGCLTLPFRLLMLAVLLLLGYLAWSYRDVLRRKVHEWTADGPRPEVGVPVAGRAKSAAGKIEALLGSRADSVTLSPAEVASLIDSLARIAAPGVVDSVSVTLGGDDVEVKARVDTRNLSIPLGSLGGMVRDHETAEAGGPLVFRQPGQVEWSVERVFVRGIPLPRELYERFLRRFSAVSDGRMIGVPIPRTVTGLRVGPQGITLYGAGR
jgi:hypothetical protein